MKSKEAQSGDLLLAGRALICPGNRHMKVRRMEHGNVAILVDAPRVNGHRPSVDVLFQSVAQEFKNNSLGCFDDRHGRRWRCRMSAVQSAGGITIAQSPETCVVDSMPRAAIERGFADRRGFPFEFSRCDAIEMLAGVLDGHPSRRRSRDFSKEIVMKQFEATNAKERQPGSSLPDR